MRNTHRTLPRVRLNIYSVSQNNIFILHSLSGTMLFKSFGGASDFVLEFPGLSPGVPVGVPEFVVCAMRMCMGPEGRV